MRAALKRAVMVPMRARAEKCGDNDDGVDHETKNTPRPPVVLGALSYQLDAGSVKGVCKFHLQIDVATDDPVAGLHALDGGHGEAEPFGQSALVEAEERSGGPHPAAVIMFVTSVLYVAPGN